MYLDCYILENILINYIIINCVVYISREYTKIHRKLLATVFGASYSVIYLFFRDSLLFSWPFKFIVIIIIVNIAFQIKNSEQFLKIMMYFYLVNIFISGSTYFIMYFTGISHITVSFLIICSYISCKLLKIILNNIKLLKHSETLKKDIKIVVLDNKINCTALLDSGNLLKDPISKDDVVVVKAKLVESFFKNQCSLDTIDFSNIQDILDSLNPNISNRVRMIPYKHAGSSNSGMLIGIRADYLEVDDKKISNIILGISNFNDDNYSAILNPRILY